jgi:hypothetical protein
MFTGLLKQFFKQTAVLTATLTVISVVMVMGLRDAHAAPPASLSCSISPVNGTATAGVPYTFSGNTNGGKGSKSYSWNFTAGGGVPGTSTDTTVDVTYPAAGGPFLVTLQVTDKTGAPANCNTTVTVQPGGGNTPPTANPDSYTTTTTVTLNVAAPGVLLNDTDDGQPAPLVVSSLILDVTNGTLNLNQDGSFSYVPTPGNAYIDSFTYQVSDGEFTSTAVVTIDVTTVPPAAQCSDGIDNDGDGLTDFPADPGCIDANDNDETDPLPPIDPGFADQTDFKIMMNYELGMHCTGFEFAYCCVLPVYNSILAQVVKPNTIDPNHSGDYARLMEGDPREGLDALGRETVVRDKGELDGNGNFKKYVLKYWHDAQPRNDGRGKAQASTLISAVEGNSLMAWNTRFDSAALDGNGKFITGTYNGAEGVVLGDGDFNDPSDNYQNAVWNHLYFYENLEGGNSTGTSLDANKIRLGVNGHVVYPADCGAALHPMGPVTQGGDKNAPAVTNDCGGFSNGNVLTFSGDKGTVVYTQMKVLENLPVMLTSPDIWEALGLPLTPFEDSVDFFSDPGLLDEDSVRPYVAMKAQMYDYDPGAPGGAGAATLDSNGDPVIGFGTAPIDIPNCERCHSNPPNGTMIQNAANEGGGMLTVVNSPNEAGSLEWIRTQQEKAYWDAYYNIDKLAGDSDWYSRLKSAAISMLTAHDTQHGTSFTANYPGIEETGVAPQNTRMGHESVVCQRCHADNVIAAVKSANCGTANETGTDPCTAGTLIKPITEAVHNNHRGISMLDADGNPGVIAFSDSLGRDGGCQGCHPAHRSDGDMNGYPITLAGANKYADGDNRGANGGCFVGRDVHSNPGKDSDGVETPAHLNAVGQYLADNVASDGKGIWCTNCHNQLGQEMWKAENMTSLVHNQGTSNPRAEPTLAAVAAAVGATEQQAMDWLDPKDSDAVDHSYAIWAPDPGLCNYVAGYFGGSIDPAHDGAVATVEVNVSSAAACSTGGGTGLVDCRAEGGPAFYICGTTDGDNDFSVNALDFCTTPDCVAAAQTTLPAGSVAVPVPFSAATDGRDHWLSAGEPHCADCHAAPFVEQSGNINAYPPFNYPRKASLMRYSKGHQNISCQGCHESIHGLYPVTPNIDTTTYAQAAALNADGSHGPLKCGTCHLVNGVGVPSHIEDGLTYKGQPIKENYDAAVAWMHTFTDEADPRVDYCLNCHTDNSGSISSTNRTWTEHAYKGRSSREMMDKVELLQLGHVAGDPAVESPENTVCTSCHGSRTSTLSRRGCSSKWRNHLIQGRASEAVWEYVSTKYAGTTCGW